MTTNSQIVNPLFVFPPTSNSSNFTDKPPSNIPTFSNVSETPTFRGGKTYELVPSTIKQSKLKRNVEKQWACAESISLQYYSQVEMKKKEVGEQEECVIQLEPVT